VGGDRPKKPITGPFGIVGGGVIGSGWAARALSRGYAVVAHDPADGAESRMRTAVDRAWPAITQMGLYPGADPTAITFVGSPEEVGEVAGFVQEAAPEVLDVKQAVLRQISEGATPTTMIASSTSGLLPSELQRAMRHPERLVVGHPFNPVYLLPLVELVGGEQTVLSSLTAAEEVYRDLDMKVLRVRNEIEGFLSDRLQEALWREILHLVADDVANTSELDDAIVYGPGLRWAIMGTNLTFHLAGGEQGMRHMFEQFGPALEWPWTKLVAPPLTNELIDRMVDGTQRQADGRSIAELERIRDEALVSIMQALEKADVAAGEIAKRRRHRTMAASSFDR